MHASPKPRTFRTIAAVAALSLGASAFAAGTASAASKAPKAVKFTTAQAPQLLDRPGDANDVVRVTNVPGAVWTVDGTEVTFKSGRSTADTGVSAASSVTLEPVVDDELYDWQVAPGSVVQCDFPQPSADTVTVRAADVVATFSDLPGSARDTVVIRKVEGVQWTVGDATYLAENFGSKKELTLKLTSASAFSVELVDGAVMGSGETLPTPGNTLTDSEEVALSPDVLAAAVDVGDNPFDPQKGYGTTGAKETVRINAVRGVKWKIGTTAKPISVRGVAYVPVDPDDLEESGGKVTVTAVPDSGYTVPADWSTEVDFADDTTPVTRAFVDDDAVAVDRGGARNDTLTLKAERNMTWYIAQQDAKNKWVWKAQKADKSGNVVYKVKHTKPSKNATPADASVRIRPVADRGFLVDTTGLSQGQLTTPFTFKQDPELVPVANQGLVGESQVTLTAHDGVAAWTVKDTLTVGTKTSAKSTTFKPTGFTRLGASGVVVKTAVAEPTVKAKYNKDYAAGS